MNSKNLFFTIAILAIIVFGGLVLVKGDSQLSPLGGTGSGNSGNAQVVKMYVNGGSYVLEPSEFKKGVPVKIEADISRTPGCSRAVVISAFGIRKTLTSSDNTITFTPDKAGTFNIACSMNMYRGTFTVLENDGSKSNYVDISAPKGGSCGSGGCGCGGAR